MINKHGSKVLLSGIGLCASALISCLQASEHDLDARENTSTTGCLSLITGALFEEKPFPARRSFFEGMPPEGLWHITSFLPETDKYNFSLCDYSSHQMARAVLVHTHIPSLKDIAWAHGPTKGTFENYLFNTVLWKMGAALLKDTLDDRALTSSSVLLKAVTYFGHRFGDLAISEGILKSVASPKEFLVSNSGKIMAQRALENPLGGEGDFLSLIRYLATRTYEFPQEISMPMGLLERFHRVKEARRLLESGTLTWPLKPDHWNTVLAYSLDPITIKDFKRAAHAYYVCGTYSVDRTIKNASFMRAADLYEIILEKIGEDAIADDITWTARAHYFSGKSSDTPIQKLSSFVRAGKIIDFFIKRKKDQATSADIEWAIRSYTLMEKDATDPQMKRKCRRRLKVLVARLKSFEK